MKKNKLKISLAAKFAIIFSIVFSVIIFFVNLNVREKTVGQFTRFYENQVDSSLHSIDKELLIRRAAMAAQLKKLSVHITEDNEFRKKALFEKNFLNPFIIDYSINFMQLMGLQVLEITTKQGTVISSGHDRVAIGKDVKELIKYLHAAKEKTAFAWFEGVRDSLFCLVYLDSTELGSQKFYLIGGLEISPEFLLELQGDASRVIAILLPDTLVSSISKAEQAELRAQLQTAKMDTNIYILINEQPYVGMNIRKPFLYKNAVVETPIFLLHPETELTRLLAELNEFSFIVLVIAVAITILLSIFLTKLVTHRLKRLTTTAESLSLDKLDVEFKDGGLDEVGILSRKLQEMVKRLRQSFVELSVAEQKAAFAEIARQVNHDIKNGFIPIRKVMEHWEEVSLGQPEELVKFFKERKNAVMESLEYLENLARRYSRLRPNTNLTDVDVNQLIESLLKNYQHFHNSHVHYEMHLDSGNPRVEADTIQLRRALENILRNALEALNGDGNISVSTQINDGQVIITWKDNGSGIPKDILERLFTSPVSTKPEGSGIGLANVKRIIESFNGRVSIKSVVKQGTTVQITLPQHKPPRN